MLITFDGKQWPVVSYKTTHLLNGLQKQRYIGIADNRFGMPLDQFIIEPIKQPNSPVSSARAKNGIDGFIGKHVMDRGSTGRIITGELAVLQIILRVNDNFIAAPFQKF